ncbi:MAG: class I SAM-dependent methyltransferase [Paludibacteraceae bacterium]|nr:class I SAM-dependent methyltransferase [Paludibacteraceae bacterium]
MKWIQTAERASTLETDNYVLSRCKSVYHYAATQIQGKVLEIGTGTGYGVDIIAPRVTEFWTLDKYPTENKSLNHEHVNYIQQKVPPLLNIPSNYFDYVVCFQVIEHIKPDEFFLQEINRVLKNDGKLILTTPNIDKTLVRNPWHVREYQVDELKKLMMSNFEMVEMYGVYGNDVVNSYYEANKAAVEKLLKLDFLSLNKRLPGLMLQLPYDLCNRINRYLLMLKEKQEKKITENDFYLKDVDESCLDFFVVSQKRHQRNAQSLFCIKDIAC